MKKLPFKLSLVFLVILLMPSWLLGASIMERLEKKYEKIHSIKATFEQETTMGIKKKMTYQGTVYIVPGKSRWNYEEPAAQIVVTDGDSFLLYDPANKEAVKGILDKEALVTRGPFFSLVEQIKKYYNAVERESGNELVLTLTPKAQKSPVQKVVVYLDPKSLLIERVENLDSLGNLNTITFKNIEVNPKISPKTFQLQLPPDVKVSKP